MEALKREFTATAYIIKEGKTLLLYHKKLKKWLPPGGHLHPNELPPDGARREALEETGLEVKLIKQENIWINRWNATSFERPYLCLLEEIPPHNDTAAHQHIDFIYLATPVKGVVKHNDHESTQIKWFTADEVEKLIDDEEIFVETKETLRKIFLETALTPENL